MKKIELICIGNQKFKYLRELEKKYSHKINFFATFSIKQIKEVKIQNENLIREKAGKKILEHIDKKDFVIGLDQAGKKMDSNEFAQLLSNKMAYLTGKIVFLIGGHSGLSEGLDKRIDLKLSFSDMTFAHDIFRIIF